MNTEVGGNREKIIKFQPRAGIPIWKRPFDCLCLVFLAPAWVPLMVFIATYIKIVSNGPIFYRQSRVGLFGTTFQCLKFRTMKKDACIKAHQNYVADLIHSDLPMTKLDRVGDNRLIPFGGILRACGLDELPQILNILRGEMSIVGPRPCLAYEYQYFLPFHKRRCEVLPGLTGLWQVSGKNETTFSEMIRLDIYYVDYHSIWMDVRIILSTVSVLLKQISLLKETASASSPFPGRAHRDLQKRTFQ